MSIARFITLWTHPNYAPEPVAESELEAAERQLGSRVPSDYRDAIVEFGLPRPTSALLEAIVEQGLDVHDVSEFFSPREMIEATNQWREAGLPKGLIAFASDCMGNLFCFPADTRCSDQQPVSFWNHDEHSVEIVARSFTSWIEGYGSLAG